MFSNWHEKKQIILNNQSLIKKRTEYLENVAV